MMNGIIHIGYKRKGENNMFNDDAYLEDVSKAFERLSKANTPDELNEVLANWPDKENYFIKNEEEIEDINHEIENLQK